MDIHDMSARDRGMYWNGSIVFNKRTGKAYYVDECSDVAVIHSVSSPRRKEVELDDFQEKYLIHRTKLGWINVGIACMFGYSAPGRSNRKAYVPQEIKVVSPVYNHLIELFTQEHTKQREEDPFLEKGTPDKLKHIKGVISKASMLEPHPNKYLKGHGTLGYFTKEQVFDRISRDRVGCALSPYWAVIQLPSNSEHMAAIYHQGRIVGSANLEDREFSIYPRYNELKPAWRRI